MHRCFTSLKKDRASFVSAGALMMGDDVNITSKDVVNSGRISATHNLSVHSDDILGKGGILQPEMMLFCLLRTISVWRQGAQGLMVWRQC